MNTKTILASVFALAALASCKSSDIPTYKVEDSAVNFKSTSFQFSLKGNTADTVRLTMGVTLVGPATDYDRSITVMVDNSAGNTAIENQDFFIRESKVKAGALEGAVVIDVTAFPDSVSKRTTTIKLVPNNYFRAGFPSYSKANVIWSEEYVRPEVGVWRYWYLYFCHGYSKRFHSLLIELFGDEVETYTGSRTYVNENPALVLKMPDWYYAANHAIFEYVKDYDNKHPGEPLRHSDDFEAYTSYLTAAGDGEKTNPTPTIYETLVAI